MFIVSKFFSTKQDLEQFILELNTVWAKLCRFLSDRTQKKKKQPCSIACILPFKNIIINKLLNHTEQRLVFQKKEK